MTFRTFLDTAHTILVDEHVRLGQDLLSALEDRKEWAASGVVPIVTGNGKPKPESRAVVENDAALAQLEMMMQGVGRG